MKTNQECKGCKSLMHVTEDGWLECHFTDTGTSFIPNCICGECLVKGVCVTPCEDFLNKANSYKRVNKLTLLPHTNKKAYKQLICELSKNG